MFEYKVVLAGVAILLGLFSYVPYYRDIFRGKTKPHAFSWLVWASLTGIIFFAQLFDKGGAGAWVAGFTAVICFSIFILSLKKGEKNITRSDKLSLFGAGIAVFLWYLTSSPLISVILVIIIDAMGGFYPTIRKSYSKPYEETVLTYLLSGLKWVFAIIALENYTLITTLDPVFAAFTNLAFVALLLIRRKQHKKINISHQGF
jgi:hypothetical protein